VNQLSKLFLLRSTVGIIWHYAWVQLYHHYL